MCGNYAYLFRCLGFFDRGFLFGFQAFIDGMCVMAFALLTKTMSGPTIHHLVVMLLMSARYFLVFSIEDLCGKYVVTICKFLKLCCESRPFGTIAY